MKVELAAVINGQQAVGVLDLKKLADQGNIDACNTLGTWLLSGLNCSPNLEQAVRYFEKAARKGHTTAMINLALCYAEGRGVKKDFDLAEMWIRAADECGDKNANVPARQIYISTIGYHKPNMREYTDYLFQSFYPNGTDLDEAVMKNTLIANMILSEVGVSKDYSELSKMKATENDIASYEIMNDVFCGDPVLPKPGKPSDGDKVEKLDDILTGIAMFGREDIADRAAALYYLASNAGQKKQLVAMGRECKKSFECPETPTWLDRAKFGIKQSFLGAFDKDAIQGALISLRSQLDIIEEDELAEMLQSCGDSADALISARKKLQKSNIYGENIKTQWLKTYSEKIAVSQEAELSAKYETAQNDIIELRKLLKDVSSGEAEFEDTIIEKWLPIITEKITTLENDEVSAKFETAGNDRSELVALRNALIAVGSAYTKDTIKRWSAPITDKIVALESEELSARFEAIKSNRPALQKMIRELPKSGYLEQTISSWTETALACVMSLEESEVSCRLEQNKTNYAELLRLDGDFKNRAFMTEVIVKWRDTLHTCLIDAQKIALDELCCDLSQKSRDELFELIQRAEKNYSYDNNTLQSYIDRIKDAICAVEKAELESIVADAENLSSQELIGLKYKVEQLRYTKSAVTPIIQLLDDRIMCAKIIESCSDENLSELDFDALTERKNAVVASNVAADKQAVLVDRIDSYLDLIRTCKDTQTVELLQQCQESILVTLSVEKLVHIKKQVETHRFIPNEEKSTLVSNIADQIAVQTIREKIAQATGNYDALISLLQSISEEKMPDEDRAVFEADVRQKIVEAQKANLDRISTGLIDMSHDQLKKAVYEAKHYSFDAELLNNRLTIILEHLDVLEQQRLGEICAKLDDSSIDDIQKMRTKIQKYGFRAENAAPYLERMEARHSDLYYLELVQKCKKETLVAMPLQALVELQTELDVYVSKKDDAQQHVDLLRELVDIIKWHNKALSDLSNQFIPAIIDAASTSIQSMRQRMKEYYKPEVYIQGEKFLAEYKKNDTFRGQYWTDVERQIFGIYLLNGSQAPKPTLSITNLSVYVGQRKIPVETITQVKPVMLLGGISLVTATETIDVHSELPYAGKGHLATAIAEIINYVTNCKRNMQAPLAQIESTFNKKLAECFGEEPTPVVDPVASPVAAPVVPVDTMAQTSTPAVNNTTNVEAPVAAEVNAVQTATTAAPAETGMDKLNKAVAQSLEGLNKAWNELTPIQLSNALSALTIKHSTIGYITYRSESFEKKLPKAKAAYARIGNGEVALVMEDQTIFGSAKEGFVLTDKNIYINISGCKNAIVPLNSATGAFCRRSAGLTDVIISSSRGEYRVSYRSSDAEGNACAAFLSEVISWLNSNAEKGNGPTEASKQGSTIVQEQWLCSCGNINDGNFCSSCGGRKEAGIILWQCSCGSLNKGKFCSKCGSPKKE